MSAADERRAPRQDETRFDRWAADYDESPYQSRLFQPLHAMTVREAAARMPHPRRVLDLGCGTGQFLRRAAGIFPGADLVGVDASAEMIQAAQAAAEEGEPIRFLNARAEALPLDDASVDLAVTTASFHHWTDQPAGVAEVRRVLGPDGVFVLADILAAGVLRVRPLRLLFGRLDGGRFNTPEVLDRMLVAAGFEVASRTAAPKLGGALQVTVARVTGSRS